MIIRNATMLMEYSARKSSMDYSYEIDNRSPTQSTGFPRSLDRENAGYTRIPCQVVPIEEENVSYTSASGKTVFNGRYMILVEARHLKERISKYHRIHNMKIGIIMDGAVGTPFYTTGVSIEYLRAVNQYKIICR